MSKKSGKSSGRKTKSGKALERPFEQAVLRRAKRIAFDYRLVLERNDELGFVCTAVELPTVFAQGPTPDACVDAAHDAMTVAVATMIECGQSPPLPSSAGKRQVQINVRLTPDEKLLLQETARRLGFKGISDFVRNAALKCSSAA